MTEFNGERRRFLGAAALSLFGVELGMLGFTRSSAPVPSTVDGELSPLRDATAWLNSPPLTAAALRGKVVLVNFLTYTCINWLRQLPYVRAWAEKYRDKGLVLIGVHTPEFGFEHDLDNVRRALKAMRVEFPIAVDNDYAIWSGFHNQYWPALYFLDAQGSIRHRQFGEGGYEECERVMQRLLVQAGVAGIGPELVTVEGQGIEAPADWDNLRSLETYIGTERGERFAANSTRLRLNEWTLAGPWTRARHAAVLNGPNGRIVSRFHSRDVHLVLAPTMRGASVRFRIRIDGQPPTQAHGGDVERDGQGVVTEQRLYQLVRQPGPITDRTFEIEFLDGGVEAFAFTFG